MPGWRTTEGPPPWAEMAPVPPALPRAGWVDPKERQLQRRITLMDLGSAVCHPNAAEMC